MIGDYRAPQLELDWSDASLPAISTEMERDDLLFLDHLSKVASACTVLYVAHRGSTN